MRHATQEDINEIDDIGDIIAAATTKLAGLLRDIGTPVAQEALETWVKRIDVAISNAPQPEHLDQKTLDDTVADLAGERRRTLKVRP